LANFVQKTQEIGVAMLLVALSGQFSCTAWEQHHVNGVVNVIHGFTVIQLRMHNEK